MSRRAVASLILTSWAASLGWLAWRTYGSSTEMGTEVRSVRLAPVSAFYAVLAGDVQIGTAGISLDTTALGYRLTEVLALDLPGPPAARHVLRSEAALTRTLRLQRITATVSEAGQGFSLDASLAADSSVLVRSLRASDGRARELLEDLPPRPGLTLPSAVPYQLAASRRLRPRGSLATPVLDAVGRATWTSLSEVRRDSLWTASDSAVMSAGGTEWQAADPDSIRAWEVIRGEAGFPVRDWIDGQGRVLAREYALGLRLAQSPFEVNYTNYQNRVRTEGRPAIPPLAGTTRLIDQSRRPDTSTGEVRAVIRRRDGAVWPGTIAALAGGRQATSADTVVIRGHPVGADTAIPTRWRNTPARTEADSSALRLALRNALQAHPEEPDTLRRLVLHVAHGVRYFDRQTEPTGFLTAIRGPAGTGLDGKVALMVALARAAGYPARAVSGVDLSHPSLPSHAWVEVWRAGWQAVDPVLGNMPASPWLLRLMEGSAGRAIALAPMFGMMEAQLLSPAPGGRR